MAIQQLLAAHGAAGGSVSYVAGSATTFSTVTSQDVAIPASAAVGDLLLAHVMHRDTLTPPAGWTLVQNQTCSVPELARQDLSVYQRTAIAGDPGASTTWTQATSARMAVHIQAFRKAGGAAVVTSAKSGANNVATSSNILTWPSVTGTGAGQLAVSSTSLMRMTSPDTVTATSGTITTANGAAEIRMAASYVALANGAELSGNHTWPATAGTTENGHAKVSILVG